MVQVPAYLAESFSPRQTKYCLCIPVINEGEKILRQLGQIMASGIPQLTDVIVCDGGSRDGSVEPEKIRPLGVTTLLTKTGPGKLSAQLRMGYYWAMEQGYEGVITVDGNGKDSVESVPLFVEALDKGFDMVQGSRYIAGGRAVNTPALRHWAVKLLHVPVISWTAGFSYTDTTNGFRGYSRRYLLHPEVQPFRNVFNTYELLAYLSVRAPQLGLATTEVPVAREYPADGTVPTKISLVGGNWDLLKILWKNWRGEYLPSRNS